jgi:hypothetical protein
MSPKLIAPGGASNYVIQINFQKHYSHIPNISKSESIVLVWSGGWHLAIAGSPKHFDFLKVVSMKSSRQ